MSTHRKRLLHDFPTVETLLGGEARVDSNHTMTSSLSLLSEDVEKRAPTGIHDTFRKVMVFHHVVDTQFLDSDMVIVFGVLLGDFIVKITALTGDLQVRFSRVQGGFASTMRSLLTAAQLTLFASQKT